MKLSESYKILELPETATQDETKKQFKKLAAQFHPDVNKASDAEAKFKKINEAYECVKAGKGNEREDTGFNYDNINPFGGFVNFQQQNVLQADHIETHLSISFKESVLGCKKEVKYKRNIKCNDCKGSGNLSINNGCKKCDGKGKFISQQRGMIIMNVCDMCHGKNNVVSCPSCKGDCFKQSDISLSRTVPPGLIDGNILRIQNKGNFAGSIMMGLGDSYSDLFCHIHVTTEDGLHIEGNNVISTLNISLLEALQGTTHKVKTIFGDKEVIVNPKSKHRDEIVISNCGVGGNYDQKVILNINYPENIDKLINILIEV